MKKTNLLLWLCLLAIISHAQPPAGATRAERLRYYYLHPNDLINKDKVWIMAHRGIWDEETPESSLGAFQNAIDYKFEIAELDVRFSAYVKNADGSNSSARDFILQHDKSDKRSDGSNYIPGLFQFDPSIMFDGDAKKKNKKSGLTFVALDLLQPLSVATSPNKNCIVGTNGLSPTLLKFDGTTTQYQLIHFPNTATTASNASLNAFYTIVKDNILINLDKMKDDEDFRETYDLMARIGLINQCIFKGKGLTTGFQDLVVKFGGRTLNDIMFTPIFTKYDFLDVNGQDNSGLTEQQKFQQKKAIVDDMLAAENAGAIVFPGCEIVYEEENDWLALLAEYVNSINKRVIQFSVIPENKQGVWAGNLYSWETFFQNQNYWSWIFDDKQTSATMKKIKPSVMVGDKGLEFRSYLNSLLKTDGTPAYNQTPIN